MKLNGKKIQHLMIDKELTNKQLSIITGVSYTRISNVIHGNATTYETADKIAKALGVPTLSLFEKGGEI